MRMLPDLLQQMWRYGLVGVLCTLLGLAVILACHEGLGLGIVTSNVIGYGIGLIVSFVLNGRWTFRYEGNMRTRIMGFIAVVCAGFSANLSVVFLLIENGAAFFWAQLCGVTTYSLVVFVGGRLVFSDERRGRG